MGESNNEENIIDYDRIVNDLRDADARIPNFNNRNTNAVSLLLGPTRSGKSTLGSLLANQILQVINAPWNEPIPKIIGEEEQGPTRYPKIMYNANSNMLIVDLPAYNDIEGPDQEIINAFVIHRLFLKLPPNMNNIKLLCLLSYPDCNSSNGVIVSEFFEYIQNAFPNINNIQSHIGLIITKCKNRQKARSCLEKLHQNSNSNQILHSWTNYFINNFGQQVFIFPKPSNNDINQRYPIFNDYNRILAFINSSRNQMNHIDHRIALSRNARLSLVSFKEMQKVKCQSDIVELFNKIVSKFNNVSIPNYNELTSKLDFINQLSHLNVNFDLSNQLHRFQREFANCGMGYLFIRLNNDLSLNDFIDDALSSNEIRSFMNLQMINSATQNLSILEREYKRKKYICISGEFAIGVAIGGLTAVVA